MAASLLVPQKLDFIFPFFVFFYGLLMLVVLEVPALKKLGQERLSDLYLQIQNHQKIAWISFFFGGIWSVQNLLFS